MMRRFLLLLLIAALRLPAQERIETLRLLGVYDAVTGDWIQRATVRDTLGVETQTSRAGVAALNVLTPIAGFYLLEIRKEGYQPRRIRILADSVKEFMIALSPNPLGNAAQLPAMIVTERQRLTDDPGERRGFFDRCQMKGVSCIGRAIMDKRPTAYLAQLLSQTDGIHRQCAMRRRGLVFNPAQQPDVDPATVEGCMIEMRSTAGVLCTPTYIVNGFEWPPLGQSVQTLIDRHFPPRLIEGIEVYPANGPRPQRFESPSGCGIIVIWTR